MNVTRPAAGHLVVHKNRHCNSGWWIALVAILGLVVLGWVIVLLMNNHRKASIQNALSSGAGKNIFGPNTPALAPSGRPRNPIQPPYYVPGAAAGAAGAYAASGPMAGAPYGMGGGGGVQNLTMDQWKGWKQSGRPAMVMMYADWCKACKQVMPAYQAAAAKSSIPFLALEEKQIPPEDRSGLQGYPTIGAYMNGKEFIVYNGKRTPDDFLQYCYSTIGSQ